MPSRKETKTVIRRTEERIYGVFIDGVALDRAAKRYGRKVDLKALVRGITDGATPLFVKYYTVIPHEDDARQLTFLDAISRNGLSVVVKRLPPVGIERQVDAYVEMASDMLAFAAGNDAPGLSEIPSPRRDSHPINKRGVLRSASALSEKTASQQDSVSVQLHSTEKKIRRVITIVCPSEALSYPISLANEFGADTVTVDFTRPRNRDVLKSAHKWIDLSSSESIWKEVRSASPRR